MRWETPLCALYFQLEQLIEGVASDEIPEEDMEAFLEAIRWDYAVRLLRS